ncbi:MAG TPA: hypothetical protein H9946_01085 [Candidatus Jeotgalibaca pullicola]|nr:hypothetical protein [Candidatus Jeotgalibaca pullicola]
MKLTKDYYDFLEKELVEWYENKGVKFQDPAFKKKIVLNALATADHADDLANASFDYPLLVKVKLEELESHYKINSLKKE